jgi:hypothetical protein
MRLGPRAYGVASRAARGVGCVEARRAQSVRTARGEGGSRLAAPVAVVQRQIDLPASPMEEHHQVAGVSPLELLSARPNIHSARCAGMGLTAWANKHSTWQYTAFDKPEQACPNAGRGGSRILSTMNRWTGSVEDGAGRRRSQKPSAAVHGKAAACLARDTGRPSRGRVRRPFFECHLARGNHALP